MQPMKKRGNGLVSRWRKARPLFARVWAVGGFTVTAVFALYNGGLGIRYASLGQGVYAPIKYSHADTPPPTEADHGLR